MTLQEFLKLHESKMEFLTKEFLLNVYYKDYGEDGLDLIVPEVEIYRNDGSDRKWRLDFVVTTKYKKYAIECDGFNYHAQGQISRERFDELERKRNETVRQGFILISLPRDQITENPQESIFELRRSFNDDENLYRLFLGWNKDKISPHPVQEKALLSLTETRDKGEKKGLVVLATGLGKTFLSIFDVLQFKAEKILFIVHQEYILKKSKNSFEKIVPEEISKMGFFTGSLKNYKIKYNFCNNTDIKKEKKIMNNLFLIFLIILFLMKLIIVQQKVIKQF